MDYQLDQDPNIIQAQYPIEQNIDPQLQQFAQTIEVPDATPSTPGKVAFANQTEVNLGTNTAKAINPATLSARALGSFEANKGGTDQNFTTAVATKLAWSTEEYDTRTEFASDRYTAGVVGKYIFQCSAQVIAFGVGTTNIKLHLYKNGSLFKTLQNITVLTGLLEITVQGMATPTVAVSDYFEVFIEFVGLASGTATVEGDAESSWFGGGRFSG